MASHQSSVSFVFFTFGDNLNNYTLGNFCILSLIKLAPKNSKIIVYTDKPNFYNWAKDLLTIRVLDQKMLTEWKGAHDFLWRVKIKTILDCAQKDDGHLIYLDGDTFLYNNLDDLIEKLDLGHSFMHLNEGSQIQTKSQGRLMNLINGQEICNIKMHKNLCMWNAGVVGLSQKNKVELISKVLELNDALCDLTKDNWLIEQFSLSTILATQSNILPSDEYFKHYWGNKPEWLKHINTFFSKFYINQYDATQMAASIDLTFWTSLPVFRKTKKIKLALVNLIDKVITDKTKVS